MIGEVVKEYRILSFLGEGGMGTVYRAEHRIIGKPAVVKVLRPHLSADQAALRRFVNEAMAAARIGHPGIVAVFDFGYHTSGEAYIVMEFLQGEPLSARIGRHGRLDIASAVRFLKQIAGALSAAFRVGIIHRDLKPDNVFITPDPDVEGGERAKILDFGIAKIVGDSTAVQPFTRTNALMGTPYYMSPEQCRSARDTDHRSDLYAVGCIGYEMLCGGPPFRTESLWELLRQHQFVEPQRPSVLAPDVPPALEAVIMTLLAKDPAHRYQSADDLVIKLTRVMVQKPGSAFASTRPVSPAWSERWPRSAPASRPEPIAHGSNVAAERARIEVPAVAPVAPAPTTLSLSATVRHSGPQEAIVPEDARDSARVAPRTWRSIVAAVLLTCAVTGLLSIVLVRSRPVAVVTHGGDAPSRDEVAPPGHPDAPSVVDGGHETRAGEAVDAGINAAIDAAPGPRREEQRPVQPVRPPDRATRTATVRIAPPPATMQTPPEGLNPQGAEPTSGATAASSEGAASSSCANARAPEGREEQARWLAGCGRHAQAAVLYDEMALAAKSRPAKIQLLELAKKHYIEDGNREKASTLAKRIEDLKRAQ